MWKSDDMKRSIKFVAVIVLIGGLAASCQRGADRQDRPPVPGLAEAVAEYLRADDSEADDLLPVLAANPPEVLETALRHALRRVLMENAPTGRLPGRSLHVADRDERYGLYVPDSYDPGKPHGLIVCLHGAGFDGDSYLGRWAPRLQEGYLLACPTVEMGMWWTEGAEELVLAVIRDVSLHYNIDHHRIILSGMSNGGIGTYLIGLNHPDRFAALVPMAAVLPHALFPLLDNAKHLPFYVIHGASDQVMPVRFSRDVVSYLEGKDYEVVYREHDHTHPLAGGHFFPRQELGSLVDWLDNRRRKPAPAELTVVRDRDHTGRSYWLDVVGISAQAGSFWASERDPEEEGRLNRGEYARIEASVRDNQFDVRTRNVTRYRVVLSREVVDLDRSIRIVTNGAVSFEGKVQPDARLMLREARTRLEPEPVLAAVEIAVGP